MIDEKLVRPGAHPRGEDENSPEAEYDRRHGSQQFDHERNRVPQPRRSELRNENRATDADWRGEHERDDGRDRPCRRCTAARRTCLNGGAHSVLVMNPSPNVRHASVDWLTTITSINPRMMTTTAAKMDEKPPEDDITARTEAANPPLRQGRVRHDANLSTDHQSPPGRCLPHPCLTSTRRRQRRTMTPLPHRPGSYL